MRLFAYEEDGKVAVHRTMKKGFRKPKDWIEIKEEEVPPREYRSAWVIVDGKLDIDNDKVEEIETQKIRDQRKSEYPSIGDQLDALMKWAFTEKEIGLPEELKSLAGKCMSVKAKYPLDE